MPKNLTTSYVVLMMLATSGKSANPGSFPYLTFPIINAIALVALNVQVFSSSA
jgi:hypothetical protein